MRHVPVLIDEVINSLQLKPGMNVVDCTLGDGGHAERMLAATAPDGRLLGLDADPESILRARKFLHNYGERVTCVWDNFVGLKEIAREQNFGPVHGVLLDLGWSTPQFEERRRGFSFQNLAEPLDMRYDQRRQCRHQVEGEADEVGSAAQVLNNESEHKLAGIFKRYGEEKFAPEIARAVVEKRADGEIETVKDLAGMVLAVYRQKLRSSQEVPWVGGLHPATKVFQALRIYVNAELAALEQALPQAIEVLAPGGRLAAISFHSLEDRIVKHYFKKNHNATLGIITKRPIVPGRAECENNPRARSAKLRVAEKK